MDDAPEEEEIMVAEQDHDVIDVKRENLIRNKVAAGKPGTLDEDEEEEIYQEEYIPHTEFTTVANADFAPLVCNEFVTEYIDKDHGSCQIDRADAIDLTRNLCNWLSRHDLTCAVI